MRLPLYSGENGKPAARAVVDPASLVVSPYVVSLSDETVRRIALKVLGAAIAKRFRPIEGAEFLPDNLRSLYRVVWACRGGLLLDIVGRRVIAASRADKDLLRRARLDPSVLATAARERPDVIRRLRYERLILPLEEAARQSCLQMLEIEINSQCNLRCVFCPVATDPKPKNVMPDATFELVLSRARTYGIKTISLHFYGEPTLDPALLSRVRRVLDHGMVVQLFTNATLLNEEKIKALAELARPLERKDWVLSSKGIVQRNAVIVVVNLPTVDRDEFQRVTGSKLFDRVMENIRLLKEHNVPTSLSINAPTSSRDLVAKEINDKLNGWFGRQGPGFVHSRAGSLQNEDYTSQVFHSGPLSGCSQLLWMANVTWEGKVVLCSNDYGQKHVLGDLRESSLKDVVEGPVARAYRRDVFGLGDPDADFICRRCYVTSSRAAEPEPLGLGTRWEMQGVATFAALTMNGVEFAAL